MAEQFLLAKKIDESYLRAIALISSSDSVGFLLAEGLLKALG